MAALSAKQGKEFINDLDELIRKYDKMELSSKSNGNYEVGYHYKMLSKGVMEAKDLFLEYH